MARKNKLDPEEEALWEKVIATVTPMHSSISRHAPNEDVPKEETPNKRLKKHPIKTASSMGNSEYNMAAPFAGAGLPNADANSNDIIARMIAAGRASAPYQKPKAATLSFDVRKPDDGNLNSHWDKRFRKGIIEPDLRIDLHGTGLAGAYARLDGALEQARHQKLRVILLVTGKMRSHDRASGQGRGAIASVVRDWLGASRHSGDIAAVRTAHPRHGGAGALYIILKRR